ncbi:MMEL1 [Cordylochernes scorpioides]|uniref:MMEL1 n=1 Tax=Cordylochernes scorpioides TaxID=51811 RepID=A0ABY6KB24_9ARAC|nr:MMEL1 [Cordylochernes scorpioides]
MVETRSAIPIGILYPPFYQLKRPQYLNFASLGSTLAHEMGHAFDNTGVLLNIDGSENFFSQEMIDVYMARAQCIVDQTSTFIFNQSGVVKKGYLDWEKSNGPELGLPGLNYTNYQLFFILYAQHGQEFIVECSYSPMVPVGVRSEDPSVYAVEGRGLAILIKNLYYEDIAVNITNTLDLEAQGIKVYLNQNKAIHIYNMYHSPNNTFIDDGTMAQFLTDNTIIVGDLNAKHQL